jgi:glycosyltransferase involved in cell wall biosynthesis
MSLPAVSVVFTTYNHERYVEQALRSVLVQTLLPQCELVWQDDASSDGTAACVEALLAQHPGLRVKRLLRRHNRLGRGVPWHLDLLEACAGEHVAWLEGDDAWAHPDKLSLQWQAMQGQPQLDLCFARARVIDEAASDATAAEVLAAAPLMSDLGEQPGITDLATVIRGDGGFMHTGSLFVRREVLMQAPRWFFEHQPVGDYMIQVLGAARGGALYLPQVLSLYRRQAQGSWSQRTAADVDARGRFHADFVRLLRRMQPHFGAPHKADFDALMAAHLGQLVQLAVHHERPTPLLRAASALLQEAA